MVVSILILIFVSISITMTPNQIIDYVVNHFSKNPRSLNEQGNCKYNGLNGTHCAFAILCVNPKELNDGLTLNDNLIRKIAILKPEFAGQSFQFYKDIQELHDYGNHWIKTPEGNELTESGIYKVEKLKERYK